MPAMSADRGGGGADRPGLPSGLGLAEELGLQGIPARSLVEFEGGGSMLSREVLGEMLADNEDGVLNRRGCRAGTSVSGARRNRRKRQGASTSKGRAQGHESGAIEGLDPDRLLCQQADSRACLRESTSSPSGTAMSRRHLVDARKSTKRGYKGTVEDGMERRVLQDISVGGDKANFQAPMSSTGFGAPISPHKRRRHKLYDHDHNPRVLRTLVDKTVVTGMAGAEALRAEEGKDVEELRLQLRLACHRATELEDQIFQSQTGAPHRELLGELQLDRTRNSAAPLLGRPSADESSLASTRGGMDSPTKVDLYKRCHTPDDGAGGRTPARQKFRSTPRRKRRGPLDVSFPVPGRKGPWHLEGSNSIAAENEKARPEASVPGVVTTCYPSLSPPLTPTASLRRYLSSLRPFSADSARAAWGLADQASGGSLAGAPWADRGRYGGDFADPFDCRQPRWPVLFVMGSSKPPPKRHPLGVHALPLFDDDLVALLAGAAGEPEESIRTMTEALSHFDFRLLQSAVTRLCSVGAREEGRVSAAAAACGGGSGHRLQKKRAPTQAWGGDTENEEALPGKGAAAAEVVQSPPTAERRLQGSDDEPLIISEAAAGCALTTGFLSGVFGDGAVRDIIASSRPVVVFDSAEPALPGSATAPMGAVVASAEVLENGNDRAEDLADRNLSLSKEDGPEGSSCEQSK